MRPPKRIRIGPYTYRVKRNHGLTELGTTSDADTIIRYSSGQSVDCLRDTVLHETLHACMFQAGYGRQEKVIKRLSPILLQALRDNPALVEFLLA